MSLAAALGELNTRLRAGRHRCTAEQRRAVLVLRATLPDRTDPSVKRQQRISLDLPATYASLPEAERLALELGHQLRTGTFNWEAWDGLKGPYTTRSGHAPYGPLLSRPPAGLPVLDRRQPEQEKVAEHPVLGYGSTKSVPCGASQSMNDVSGYPNRYQQGARNFSLLFTRWMDNNEWSHPVMTELARCALEGTGWLHSSQISGLRQGKLHSPGPRTFIAIERLNYCLFEYQQHKVLIPGTQSSNNYSKPYVITEDGQPPVLGWWFEIFCGVRTPKDIDLRANSFSESQANEFSVAWATFIRKLMIKSELDIITELEQTIRQYYPANDHARVGKVIAVIQNKAVWTPDELTAELPAITALTAALNGPNTEELLLSTLRKR